MRNPLQLLKAPTFLLYSLGLARLEASQVKQCGLGFRGLGFRALNLFRNLGFRVESYETLGSAIQVEVY